MQSKTDYLVTQKTHSLAENATLPFTSNGTSITGGYSAAFHYVLTVLHTVGTNKEQQCGDTNKEKCLTSNNCQGANCFHKCGGTS